MLIKHRLLASALITTPIVADFGFISLISTQHIQEEYEHLTRQTLPVIKALEDIRFNALRVVSSTSEAGLLQSMGVTGEAEDELASFSSSGDDNEYDDECCRSGRRSCSESERCL